MTAWEQRARDYAATAPPPSTNRAVTHAFRLGIILGARVQREWLTDGATALRVADALHVEDWAETLDEHEAACEEPSCNRRDAYVAPALDLLARIVGGSS